MSSETAAATARRWADRLGIGDWPTLYRTAPIDAPLIQAGHVDIVTLPDDSTEADVVHALLMYATREAPPEHLAGADLRAAAVGLAATWEDE